MDLGLGWRFSSGQGFLQKLTIFCRLGRSSVAVPLLLINVYDAFHLGKDNESGRLPWIKTAAFIVGQASEGTERLECCWLSQTAAVISSRYLLLKCTSVSRQC